jgi:hypothetical protein
MFSERFVNYVSRERILIREGNQMHIDRWYALAEEFVQENDLAYTKIKYPTYSASTIINDLLCFLHHKGYALELP